MLRRLSFIVVGSLLTACASVAPLTSGWSGVIQETESVTVEGMSDNLTNTVSISSMSYREVNPKYGSGDAYAFATVEKDTPIVLNAVSFTMKAREWEYWNEIRVRVDEELLSRPTYRAGSDVDCGSYGCTHIENVAAFFTNDQVESLAERDTITFRVVGEGASADVTMAGEELQRVIAVRDSVYEEIHGDRDMEIRTDSTYFKRQNI